MCPRSIIRKVSGQVSRSAGDLGELSKHAFHDLHTSSQCSLSCSVKHSLERMCCNRGSCRLAKGQAPDAMLLAGLVQLISITGAVRDDRCSSDTLMTIGVCNALELTAANCELQFCFFSFPVCVWLDSEVPDYSDKRACVSLVVCRLSAKVLSTCLKFQNGLVYYDFHVGTDHVGGTWCPTIPVC